MIPYKIKTLFEFIEYLYSNIDNFNQYESVLNEVRFLEKEKSKLKPDLNFSDKMKSDELQKGITKKFEVIKDNIIIPIINKSIELDICDFSNEREKLTGSWRNKYHSEINDLKKNFNRGDLSDIFSFKKKYLEFRTQTKGETYLGLDFFLGDLDNVTKNLFDFFKVTDFNEFETFEEKAIKAESIHEVGKSIQKGAKKITLPIDFLMPSLNQPEGNFEPQQLFPLENQELRKSLKEEKGDTIERLDQLFGHTSKFLAVMQILVSEKLIEPNTYIWKDTTKGNKAFLAAIIKDLHAKGYYKDKKPPENDTIELICRNTFQWKIGIDTIKRAKPSGFDLSFIPPASTV